MTNVFSVLQCVYSTLLKGERIIYLYCLCGKEYWRFKPESGAQKPTILKPEQNYVFIRLFLVFKINYHIAHKPSNMRTMLNKYTLYIGNG